MRGLHVNVVRVGYLVVGAIGIFFVLGMQCIPIDDSGVGAEVPAHLDILSATIEEVPPLDPKDVLNRAIVLRLEVAGVSRCGGGVQPLVYGFLIDTDKDTASGVADEFTDPLGVDARISAECDPDTSRFVSPLGPVTVAIDSGTGITTVEIRTTVGLLPSVDFSWIAYAEEGTLLTRLPVQGSNGAWATIEVLMP